MCASHDTTGLVHASLRCSCDVTKMPFHSLKNGAPCVTVQGKNERFALGRFLLSVHICPHVRAGARHARLPTRAVSSALLEGPKAKGFGGTEIACARLQHMGPCETRARSSL